MCWVCALDFYTKFLHWIYILYTEFLHWIQGVQKVSGPFYLLIQIKLIKPKCWNMFRTFLFKRKLSAGWSIFPYSKRNNGHSWKVYGIFTFYWVRVQFSENCGVRVQVRVQQLSNIYSTSTSTALLQYLEYEYAVRYW
jgi:hypothetical protein